MTTHKMISRFLMTSLLASAAIVGPTMSVVRAEEPGSESSALAASDEAGEEASTAPSDTATSETESATSTSEAPAAVPAEAIETAPVLDPNNLLDKDVNAPELNEGIQPYGEKVTVNGQQMNIYQAGQGEGRKTLVFLPGLSEYTQPLTQKNLIDKLAEKYHVVVVEPFGYGLSDTTETPRTADNIVDEIHEALEQIGLKRYTLVAHSLSGIYAAQYAVKYPETVAGVVGMDSSTPMMNGGQEVMQMAEPTDADGFPEYLPMIPDVADDVNEQYRLIARRVSNNKNVLEEKIQSNQTLKDARDLKIPAGIPAMYLLAQQSVDEMEQRRQAMPEINGSWEDQHVAMSEDPAQVTTHIIAGDHLLYFTVYEEMAQRIDDFVSQLED